MLKHLATIFILFSGILSSHAFEPVFSFGVSRSQKDILLKDIKVLKALDLKAHPDDKTLSYLEIDDLNADVLVDWLSQRVRYIVEDSELSDFKLNTIKKNVAYPYPNSLPALEVSSKLHQEKGVTVMSNIGAAFYYLGKVTKELLQLNLRLGFFQYKKIDITSPRVGILKIGEGLFLPRLDINRENPKAISNSLNRLSTLFHEARHSDGHGEGLGFFHSPCPINHSYAGQMACDKNLNGPYAIGAQVLREFAKNCDTCSVSEREQMKLSFLDSQSRIITQTKKLIFSSEQQGLLDAIDEALEDIMNKLASHLSDEQAQLLLNEYFQLSQMRSTIVLQAQSVEYIPSIHRDPKPEGLKR